MNGLILFLLVGLLSTTPVIPEESKLKNGFKTNYQTSLKQKAFVVLRDKCNVCHVSKKRLALFTLANMDSLQLEINNQVFIKRKMPKGKRNRLSQKEELDLTNWLNTLN